QQVADFVHADLDRQAVGRVFVIERGGVIVGAGPGRAHEIARLQATGALGDGRADRTIRLRRLATARQVGERSLQRLLAGIVVRRGGDVATAVAMLGDFGGLL